MRARERERLRRTAYHEAGHVVASYALRRGIAKARIVPNEEEGSLGRNINVRLRNFHPDIESYGAIGCPRRRVEREMQILLAVRGRRGRTHRAAQLQPRTYRSASCD